MKNRYEMSSKDGVFHEGSRLGDQLQFLSISHLLCHASRTPSSAWFDELGKEIGRMMKEQIENGDGV